MKRISSFFVLATVAAALTFAGVTPDRDKSEKEVKKSNSTECTTAVAQTGCEGDGAVLAAGQEKSAGCEGSAATLTAGQNSPEACCKSQTSTANAGDSGCSEESTGTTTVAGRN